MITDRSKPMRVAILTERREVPGRLAWNLVVALQTDGHEVGWFYAESCGPAQDIFLAPEIGRWQEPNRQIQKSAARNTSPARRPSAPPSDARRPAPRLSPHCPISLPTSFTCTTSKPSWSRACRASCGGGRRSGPHTIASPELLHNTWEMRGEISTTWEYSLVARAGLEMFCAPCASSTPSHGWPTSRRRSLLARSAVPTSIPWTPAARRRSQRRRRRWRSSQILATHQGFDTVRAYTQTSR